jgi:hypothetical protein
VAKNEREHYRIHYPPSERPLISVNATTHEILDLSEGGVRFAVPRSFRPPIGAVLKGSIRFRNNKVCKVEGTVLRLNEQDGHCTLQFAEGVPLPIIMEEQRYLLKKYPNRANDGES